MLRWLLAVLTVMVLSVAAQAQDRTGPPEAAKVLLDDERVRVTELRVAPGGRVALEGHSYQFVYMLTDGSLIITPPGKTPFELTLKSGEVSLLPSQSTETHNDGDKEVRAVVVEIKRSARPPAPAAAVGKPGGDTKVARGKKPPKQLPRQLPSELPKEMPSQSSEDAQD